MIPLSLKFQAFESYIKEAVIDFSKLDSLFLIHGETGAGKTAVLDAMTYSLYGETSGGERSDVRCADVQAEKLPTETEFIFAVKGSEYRFTRTIRLTPRSGKTETKQDCFFRDSTGMWIPFFENPKQSFVKEKAEELLGLTAEQFRQVIILPQGRFEKLLTSDSAEKEKILSTLFSADKYTQISSQLYAKADDERKRLFAVKTGIDAVLKNEHADSIDALMQTAADKKAELSINLDALKTAAALRKVLAEKLTAEELILSQFKELDTANFELSEHNLKAGEINLLKKQLERAKLSARIMPLYNEFKGLNEAVSQRRTAAEKLQSEKDTLTKKLYDIKTVGEKISTDAVAAEQKRIELTRLASLISVYEQAVPAKADFLQKQKLLKLSEEKLIKNDENCSESDFSLKQLNIAREDILTNCSQKLSSLAVRKQELEDGRKSAENISRYSELLKRIKADVSSFDSRLLQLDSDIKAKQTEYDTAYKKHISMLSAAIADSLSDGMPCPVCGSIHHPAPAKATEEVSVQALEVLKSELDAMQKSKAEIQLQRAEQAGRIVSGNEMLAKQQDIFDNSHFTEEELVSVIKEYNTAMQKNSLLPDISNKITLLTKEKSVLEEQQKKLSAENTSAKDLFSQVKFLLENLSEKLDSSISDINVLNSRIPALQNELAEFEKKSAEHEKLKAETEKKYTVAETSFAQAVIEQQNAGIAFENKHKQFASALTLNGFADEKELLFANLSDNEYNISDKAISDYAVRLSSLNEKIAVLAKTLDSKIRPDTSDLKASLERQEALHQELINKTAVLDNEFKRLDALACECRKKGLVYTAEKEKNDRQISFAQMMRGDKGMSFTRYVLGVMLTLVTAEANRLLADVLGGQFRLYRKSEFNDARTKQGLDLEVESALSSQAVRYSVRNLSGGEKFLVSLALSMGLSAAAQSRSGGVSIDAMFIDEGFGSLDPQSLREAVDVLCSIKDSRRTVGIISHVKELKEIIPGCIAASKDSGGSRLSVT